MLRELFGPDSPDLWMDYAKNDLRMAEDGVKRGYRLESLCFHAQQAAEKALKAVLVQRRILFPKSHDLERLMDLLPGDLSVSPHIRTAAALTRYSESGRYPHGFEDMSEKDYRLAVGMARDVYGWAEKALKRGNETGIYEDKVAYRTRAVVRRKKTKPKRSSRIS
jgi:HEPN domain-containing protein